MLKILNKEKISLKRKQIILQPHARKQNDEHSTLHLQQATAKKANRH